MATEGSVESAGLWSSLVGCPHHRVGVGDGCRSGGAGQVERERRSWSGGTGQVELVKWNWSSGAGQVGADQVELVSHIATQFGVLKLRSSANVCKTFCVTLLLVFFRCAMASEHHTLPPHPPSHPPSHLREGVGGGSVRVGGVVGGEGGRSGGRGTLCGVRCDGGACVVVRCEAPGLGGVCTCRASSCSLH